MSASIKLSTAVKALCYLAEDIQTARTSKEISTHIGVNASKLRKVLSLLVKSGILDSTQGAMGGFLLKKDIQSLHLQEIYCAVETQKAFTLNVRHNGKSKVSWEGNLNKYFLSLFSDIQVDIEDKMRKITLQQITDSIRPKQERG